MFSSIIVLQLFRCALRVVQSNQHICSHCWCVRFCGQLKPNVGCLPGFPKGFMVIIDQSSYDFDGLSLIDAQDACLRLDFRVLPLDRDPRDHSPSNLPLHTLNTGQRMHCTTYFNLIRHMKERTLRHIWDESWRRNCYVMIESRQTLSLPFQG